MRILAITNLYPRPGHELMAAFNRQQFHALSQRHELRVVAPVAWQETLRDRALGQVAPRHYINDDSIAVDHPTYYYLPRVLSHRYGQFYLHSVRPTIERIVKEFHPDAILACWAHPDGWAAVQLARQAGLPVVIKVVGSDVLVQTRDLWRRRRIAQALRQADRVLAVSRDLANHVERLGADPRRVHVVPEGIDRGLFSPGDKGAARQRLGLEADLPMILFVGNLLVSKGAAVLVEACRLLRDRHVTFRCDLVGQGRDERRLKALVRMHRLEEQVVFRGGCAQERLPDWYRASDVVALSSYSEGIPNVLREAMECGRPFVASRVGGIPEISHPSYSRLVEPGDAAALADALAATLREPRAVDAALIRKCNVSWQQSAEMIGAVIERVQKAEINPESKPGAPGQNPKSPRLRVLAITNQYPRLAHDAIASFNRQQFAALAKMHELRVLSPLPWPEVVGDWLRLDPRPRTYRNNDGVWVDNVQYFYAPKLFLHRHGQFFLGSIRQRVKRLLAEFKPDVLLGCWAHPDGWATVKLAREFGLPVVVKVHGSDVLVAARDPKRCSFVAEALREADRVVAVSQDLAENVIALGVPREKIEVVQNGIDEGLFFPRNQAAARSQLGLPLKGRKVLFLGNLLFSKGAGVLVEACDILRRGDVDFHCYLIGSGRDERKIRSLIGRHGLSRQVTLVGPCDHPLLPDWYAACDVVALPSFSEGLPNVLLESLACGRPFVASDVGGIPEIADPSYSRLVPPGDARSLADALGEMLADPPTVDRELVAGRTRDWESAAAALADVLQAAVAAHQNVNPVAELAAAQA